MTQGKHEPIVLDVTKLPIGFRELEMYWEMFVTITGELPDNVLMTPIQASNYKGQLIKFSKRVGVEITQQFIDSPEFRGIPVIWK